MSRGPVPKRFAMKENENSHVAVIARFVRTLKALGATNIDLYKMLTDAGVGPLTARAVAQVIVVEK